MPTQPKTHVSFKSRICADPKVATALAAAKTAHQKLLDVHAANFGELDPLRARQACLQLIESATSPEAVSVLQNALAKCTGEAGEAGRRVALRWVRQAASPFRDKCLALLDAAAEILPSFEQEITDAETRFFAEYGMPHQRTAVSALVTSLQTRLGELREGVNGNVDPATSRSYLSTVLSWFED